MDYAKVVQYWLKAAEHDVGVMQRLFSSQDYSEALFFGQLVLEKVLKAAVVQIKKEQAPKTHDLSRLAKLAGIDVDAATRIFLDEMTKSNLEARYPDYRFHIHKLATRSFTEQRLQKVEFFYDEYKKYAASKKKKNH